MAEGIYRVRIKVIEIQQKGVCGRGLNVGDEFIHEGDNHPVIGCADAVSTMWPWLNILRYGGNNPWEAKPNGFRGFFRVCCQDPDSPVCFELSRIEE